MSLQDESACALAELPNGATGLSPKPRRMRRLTPEQRNSAWILLAGLVLFAALAVPFLAGRVYVADDLGEFHLPVRDFYARQLAHGGPFDWMPSLFGGFYIAGEGQLGAYHPWHLMLYRMLPLGAAFDVELLASYPLLFAGTYFLLRRLITRRDAALFGALVFTFGGFNLLHLVHPNAIAVVAHLPWLLLAIDVILSTTNRWPLAAGMLGLGLLTASQLLLGYPQYVWFSLLAEGAFVVWRAAGGTAPLWRLAVIGLAVSLGIGAGAIQWMPTLHLLGESTRQTADSAFAETGSLHPLNLVQLLAPYLFQTRVVGQNTHELGLYVGAVPIVLCIWLLARRRQWGRYRPLIRALIVFTGVALLLAAGEFGGLYRLQSFVPLADRFRFPCRAIVLFQLGTAALAAVAAAMLFDRNTNTLAKPGGRALAATILASVILAAAAPLAWPDFVATAWLVWMGPLLIGVAAGLIALAQRGVRTAAVLLVLFTAIDLGWYGLSYSVYGRTADLREYRAGVKLPPAGNDGRVAAPDNRDRLRVGNRMLLAGLSRVDGYAGLEPAKKLDYRQPAAWKLAGASWVLQPTDHSPERDREWIRVPSTNPRARLAGGIGDARVTVDTPGRIEVETDSPTTRLLRITESFDSGWKVWVDGRPRGVVRVDGDFLGCSVGAGRHRVRFEFRPRCKRLGALVSVCSLGLMVAAGCFLVLRRSPRGNGNATCHDQLSTTS